MRVRTRVLPLAKQRLNHLSYLRLRTERNYITPDVCNWDWFRTKIWKCLLGLIWENELSNIPALQSHLKFELSIFVICSGQVDNVAVGWLFLRINVDLAIFQPYLDLEAGDYQSLKIQVARPGIEPRSSCSASQELNHSATAAPDNVAVF